MHLGYYYSFVPSVIDELYLSEANEYLDGINIIITEENARAINITMCPHLKQKDYTGLIQSYTGRWEEPQGSKTQALVNMFPQFERKKGQKHNVGTNPKRIKPKKR